MNLLTENELIWSTVVANSTMNRSRNASGLNSYEKEFRYTPELFLEQRIATNGQVKWLDLCCGEGKALAQSATYLAGKNLQHQAMLKGIDLIEGFEPLADHITCLQWAVGSVVDWQPDEAYDLITCVHGLHYVGDRLRVLEKACAALTEDGLFIANIDLRNILVANDSTNKYLRNTFRQNGIDYNAQRKVLRCVGPKQLDFQLKFEGANDKAGPNYTGQEAVDVHYSLL